MPGGGRFGKKRDGILGIEAQLDRVALRRELASSPGRGQRHARGDLDLRAHEVEPQSLLGDRVLDLQPGVHFEKVKVLAFVQKELDRSRTDVADGARRLDGRPSHSLAQAGVERRARRLFENLLVPALDAALALEEVDDASKPIAEDLKLDVARPLEIALEVHPVGNQKPLWATRRASAIAVGRSSRRSTRDMPLPPPPADALTRRGAPISAPLRWSDSSSPADSSVPGTTGNPALFMRRRAAILSPISSMDSGDGPIRRVPPA